MKEIIMVSGEEPIKEAHITFGSLREVVSDEKGVRVRGTQVCAYIAIWGGNIGAANLLARDAEVTINGTTYYGPDHERWAE